MKETLEKTELQSVQEPVLQKVSSATDTDIFTYLRRSHKIAEIAALAERDALVLSLCEKLNITVSDQEWQAAGDAFRLEHKLPGASETLKWLSEQRVSAEDWSEGIKVALLAKKLKEHLFGDAVDTHYINNRNDYKRVALSQILVPNLTDALKLVHALQNVNASFCTLALEYSKGKQSQQNGGFVGVRFVSELVPEIAQAISGAKEGEIVEPIQTKLGYHIVKVEKWFATELSESVREEILELLFQTWLKNQEMLSVQG